MLTTRRSVVSLRRTPSAPRDARRYLAHVAGASDHALWAADLLVTELVTNSVRHGGSAEDDEVEVRIEVDQHRLRVEVHDRGPGAGALEPPGPSLASGTDEGGFGLLFVNSLADRWGSERGPDGTTVWFELDTASGT